MGFRKLLSKLILGDYFKEFFYLFSLGMTEKPVCGPYHLLWSSVAPGQHSANAPAPCHYKELEWQTPGRAGELSRWCRSSSLCSDWCPLDMCTLPDFSWLDAMSGSWNLSHPLWCCEPTLSPGFPAGGRALDWKQKISTLFLRESWIRNSEPQLSAPN